MQFGFPHAGVKANGEACASLLKNLSRQMAVISHLNPVGFGAVYATVVINGVKHSIRVPSKAGNPLYTGQTAYHSVVREVSHGVARVEGRSTRLWLGSVSWAEALTYTHFEWVGDGPAPDICAYCGFNNGPHGESRYGWDCGSCGSN